MNSIWWARGIRCTVISFSSLCSQDLEPDQSGFFRFNIDQLLQIFQLISHYFIDTILHGSCRVLSIHSFLLSFHLAPYNSKFLISYKQAWFSLCTLSLLCEYRDIAADYTFDVVPYSHGNVTCLHINMATQLGRRGYSCTPVKTILFMGPSRVARKIGC